jgi:hypothetical protein
MRTWGSDVGVTPRPADRLELRVVDLSLARALFEGIPTARLLARMRLASDERDLDATPQRKNSSWDALLARMAGAVPAAAERVKRAIARHTRAASDEGPLPVDETCAAALVYVLAVSTDPDASPSEVVCARPRGDGGQPNLARTCGRIEPRLASPASDRRAIAFEACVRLATRAQAGPWPAERVREALDELAGSDLKTRLRRSAAALYPLGFDGEIQAIDRRMALLDRADLDALVAKDPRELASAIARGDRDHRELKRRETHADAFVADLTTLLRRTGELVLVVDVPEAQDDVTPTPTPIPSVRPSWLPYDWSSPDAISALADALERGATTVPRLRGLVARGGEPALDALGAEMLRIAAHPFASGAFAEVLAKSGRPRDIIRLVTYFAVAPDPSLAARVLSACHAPELPSVLRAWLEAMLPADGALAPHGENPDTSSAARLTACVAALAPYPKLYAAVRPLLARVSEPPPPVSSDGPSPPPQD